MKCPHCRQDMEDKSEWGWGLGDWDMDYPATLFNKYNCKLCKIKYDTGAWKIPRVLNIPATDRQVSCIRVIAYNTSHDYEYESDVPREVQDYPLLKAPITEYIGKYIEESKHAGKQRRIARDTAESDWREYDDGFYYGEEEF